MRGQGSRMTIAEISNHVIEFVRVHQAWAAPVVFLLAFGESLAFLSLMVPGWLALVGIGALLGASGISFWPVWIAGALGAALGDWISYEAGRWFGPGAKTKWPLRRYPELMAKAEAFIGRWGIAAVALGRFFGPAREVQHLRLYGIAVSIVGIESDRPFALGYSLVILLFLGIDDAQERMGSRQGVVQGHSLLR